MINTIVGRTKALGYSIEGLKAAYTDEVAFKIETLTACALVPIAILIEKDALWLALMLITVFAVLGAELLNSAIEAIVDLASPEKHPLAKKAKDTGSAAVLIFIIIAAITWELALSRHLFH